MILLHVGCGIRYIPDFIHIDEADFDHIDHQHDIRSLPFFSDNTVDLVYACHVIEYFDRDEVIEVLKEWKRVLKGGGIIRLAVPDFDALARVYQQYGDLNMISGPLYGQMEVKGPHMAEPKIIYHRTIYDFESLKTTLEACGFTDVRRYDWRDTIHKDYDDFSQAYIPHMDKENGLLISLNVEGTKN